MILSYKTDSADSRTAERMIYIKSFTERYEPHKPNAVKMLLRSPHYREYCDQIQIRDIDLLLVLIHSETMISVELCSPDSAIQDDIPEDVKRLLENPRSKLLLYSPSETRDFYDKHRNTHLKRYIVEKFKFPLERVTVSCTDFLNPLPNTRSPTIIGYDWNFLREKYEFSAKNVVSPDGTKKTKHIIMLNRRGNIERFSCCLFLFTHYRKKCHLSYLTCDEYQKKDIGDYGVDTKNYDQFSQSLPLTLDRSDENEPDIEAMRYIGRYVKKVKWKSTEDLFHFIDDSFIMLVFETNFEPLNSCCQQVSEKTYKPIKSGIPFIIFTSKPGILDHLRRFGFRTFSPFINEAYDMPISGPRSPEVEILEKEYLYRYRLLIEELDRLCKMSRKEISELYQNCLPIVEHNLSVLQSPDNIPKVRIVD